MLQKSESINPSETEAAVESVSISELIEQFTGFIRRQFSIFLFISACTIGLSLAYLYTAPARYTAHAMMLIDSGNKVRMLQEQQSALADIPLDTAQVETQLEIFKSENIGLSVIKDRHLTNDPEFIGTGGGFIGTIFAGLAGSSGLSEPKSEAVLTRTTLSTFLGNRAITRVGRTYVLDLAYTSLSPTRAADIANAIADAYIVDQLEAKYQANRRASIWLQDRIKELRQQATVADSAVLVYKEKNNIVDAGASGGPRGRLLLGEQQLADVNTQLSTARGARAEARARLERINEVMNQDIPDAGVTDSLHSDVINRLRNQYLDMSARERTWSARYGSSHLAAVNLRLQMNELRRSISDELGRIAESYKSDYEIATTRERNLEKDLATQILESQSTNRDRLGLRDLESQAEVFHKIYDNFLQRYMEATQQESFPITEARVISAATSPTGKSSPRTFFVLGIAASFGMILSFAIGFLREAIDRVFRSTRNVEELLRMSCLAVLPVLKNVPSVALISGGDRNIKAHRQGIEKKTRVATNSTELLRYVVHEPLSSFAEALRAVKVAVDINRDIKNNKIIGITSTIPREGKSTISCNLAQLMAHAGKRVILIDGDLRNPSVTRDLAANANVGLLEVLAGKVQLSNAVVTDDDTGLVILPTVIETRLVHTNEILVSEVFKQLLEGLRKAYDYIIVDLPPVAPVVDVRATINVIDSYIYVIEWGHTKINLVQHQLAGMPEVQSRILGVVLNKANIAVLERYEYHYGSYYGKKYYARYGYGG